jgi:hypothetical protein
VEKDFHLEVIQVKEEREQKQPQVGFKGQNQREEQSRTEACRTGFPYISAGHSLDSRGYPWVIEGKVTGCPFVGHRRESHMDFSGNVPEQVIQQHMCFQVCLQCIILSVGHFPCYGSPDLTLIKASLDWFSLQGFSRGLPKNLGVLMCLIWFPCLCFHCMFS